MLGRHGSIVIPQNTPYADEMRKHEAHYTEFGPPGRPYPFQPGDEGYEFPKRIYKAFWEKDRDATKAGIGYDGFTVNNETELLNMRSRGYAATQQEALTALEREHTEHGKLAAERNWEASHGRLSERAVSEMRSAESEHGARHLPAVPETPIRRRRGPNKPKVSVPA